MRLAKVVVALGLVTANGAHTLSAEDACPGSMSVEVLPPVKADYRDVVMRYALGERTRAVAALTRFSESELCSLAKAVEAEARMAARADAGFAATLALQRGDAGDPPIPLRAAVMLHMDYEGTQRPTAPSLTRRTEQPRTCPGRQALIASRYARLLAGEKEYRGGMGSSSATRDFARRFFIALAHHTQWDACFQDADYWAREGLKLFPHDPDLLVAVGSVTEESATLGLDVSTFENPTQPPRFREEARAEARSRERVTQYKQARAFYEEAIAADDRHSLARLRLGRVLWRSGENEAAQATLERVTARSPDPPLLYLAHLFLGQVHEDSGRLPQAEEQYRLCLELDPKAQAAAVALSHALGQAGEVEEARDVLRRGLAQAGRRGFIDAYWDYLAIDAIHFREEYAALREESRK